MRVGDLLQHAAAFAPQTGKSARVAVGAVGDNRDAVFFAPRDNGVLDRTFAQMVEDLVAGRMAPTCDRPHGVEIGRIEVAHAPRQDLAFAPEPLERANRVFQRIRARPVQKIAIQAVGLEARERRLARRHRPAERSMLGKDLGDEENLVAPPCKRLAHQFLGGARTVKFRSVDVVHTEIESPAQRGDGGLGIALVDVPGTLADHWDLAHRRAEPAALHAPFLLSATPGNRLLPGAHLVFISSRQP